MACVRVRVRGAARSTRAPKPARESPPRQTRGARPQRHSDGACVGVGTAQGFARARAAVSSPRVDSATAGAFDDAAALLRGGRQGRHAVEKGTRGPVWRRGQGRGAARGAPREWARRLLPAAQWLAAQLDRDQAAHRPARKCAARGSRERVWAWGGVRGGAWGAV
eukprot:1654821-Prymnesium_polylepis.1